MECPKCGAPRRTEQITCDDCGIVFHKYAVYLEKRAEHERRRAAARVPLHRRLMAAGAPLLTATPELSRYWWAYAALWCAFAIWGASYMATGVDALGHDPGVLHHVNLPFHEAGHLIFSPLGDWMGSLGGTLGQLLMPLIAGIALLHQRGDTFGASLCLWWFAQNFLDVAPYMADARAGVLPLLGGNYGRSSPYGFHDWEFILGETGLLAYDTALAALTFNAGRALMLLALAWGGYLLFVARRADPQQGLP